MSYKALVTPNSDTEEFGGTISVKAQQAGVTYTVKTEGIPAPSMQFKLVPGSTGSILAGSVVFTFGGSTYIDRSGTIYRNVDSSTNAGTAVGSIDYDSRVVTLTSYPGASLASIQLISCLITTSGFGVTASHFRTSGAPLRPASLQISAVRADTGQVVTAVSDLNGNINNGIIKGTVDHQTGVVKLRFTTNVADESGESEVAVIPTLLRYNAVVQTQLPLDADLIGLDPVRLPADGRVPIFREGYVAVLHNTKITEVVSPVAGGTVALGRGQVSSVEVMDPNGLVLPPSQYTFDAEAGLITWANPLVLQDSAAAVLDLPLYIHDRVEHMALITEVQITGEVSLSADIPWDLPAEGTYLSSAVTWGDLQARLYNWFTQQTWNSSTPNWTNSIIGGTTTAQYNSLGYPQLIANNGAVTGKWALVFTSATTFNVVEQAMGVVASGNTGSDCAPINPMTQTPYFTIKREGWGTGWASGNAVRFNTTACLGPMWVVRTVVSGKGTVEDDNFKIQIRGDAD